MKHGAKNAGLNKLLEAGVKTMDSLADLVGDKPTALRKVEGIGKAMAQGILDAFNAFKEAEPWKVDPGPEPVEGEAELPLSSLDPWLRGRIINALAKAGLDTIGKIVEASGLATMGEAATLENVEGISRKASEEILGAVLALRETRSTAAAGGPCVHCQKDCTDADYCYGCKSFVCDDCNQRSQLAPHDNPDWHKQADEGLPF